MNGSSFQTFSNAQIIVCFVGFIFITIFIKKLASMVFQKLFPNDESFVTDEELRALKQEIADLREIIIKAGVDAAEFKHFTMRK